MSDFQNIPDEITLEIFSYLSVHTIRCILPRVCQLWRQLATDEQLWRNLSVVTDNISEMCFFGEKAFLSFYHHTPQIQNLRISARMIERLPIDSRHNIKNLHIIDVTNNNMNFLKELWTFSSLERLKFDVVGFGSMTKSFISDIKKICGLRELKIGKNTRNNITTKKQKIAVVELLKNILESSQNITHLVIKFALSDDELKCIISIAKNIRNLHLSIGGLSPAAVASLKMLPDIKRLTVSDDRLDVNRLRALKSLPVVNMKLSEPFMSPVFSSSEMNRFLSSEVSVFSNVTRLSIAECRVSDETAKLILKNCPSLRYLILRLRSECDEEFSVIGVMHLLHLRNLRVLRIYDMKGKDWGFVRDSWKNHDCAGVDECTLGLDDLLVNWREIELEVV